MVNSYSIFLALKIVAHFISDIGSCTSGFSLIPPNYIENISIKNFGFVIYQTIINNYSLDAMNMGGFGWRRL